MKSIINKENNNNNTTGTSNHNISVEMALSTDNKYFIKYASSTTAQSTKLIGFDFPKTLVIIYRFLYFCTINII
jgi:hypothetical protein